MRRGRRVLWPVVATLLCLCVLPACASATGNATTGNTTGNNAYETAVETATHPVSYAQAVKLFTAIGGWLVVLASVPVLVVFVLGGVAGYWHDTAFWAVVVVAGVLAGVLVAATPYVLVLLR